LTKHQTDERGIKLFELGLGVSLFMHWRGQDPKRANATLPDFHEEMGLEYQRQAGALVNPKQSRAVEAS